MIPYGNIRFGSLSVGIAALNRRLHMDYPLTGKELATAIGSLRSLMSLESLMTLMNGTAHKTIIMYFWHGIRVCGPGR